MIFPLAALVVTLGAATYGYTTNKAVEVQADKDEQTKDVVTGELRPATPSQVLLVIPTLRMIVVPPFRPHWVRTATSVAFQPSFWMSLVRLPGSRRRLLCDSLQSVRTNAWSLKSGPIRIG